ncbi:Voltage-gated potassium channel subunit beta, partial [Phytophthora palmivora]
DQLKEYQSPHYDGPRAQDEAPFPGQHRSVGVPPWLTFDTQLDFEKAYSIMEHAYKNGVNFFDNAEVYANGQSELIMGKVVKTGIERKLWEREDLVISTKLFFGTKSGPNDGGNSRKHIVEGMKASLKRFDLDYVDLVLCHRPDPATPIEETVRAMNFLIDQGWAFYWGTSEWCAKDIIEACEIADRLGLIRPVFDQPEYHIFERSRVEYDFDVLYKKYNYGLTTWSPLASGILTGKYSKGIPEGSRLSMQTYKDWVGDGMDEYITKADKLNEVAKEVGCSLAQLSIAWVAANPHVSTVILGATSIKQLDENLKAMEFVDKITPEIREKIDAIADFKPKLVPQAEDQAIKLRQKWL